MMKGFFDAPSDLRMLGVKKEYGRAIRLGRAGNNHSSQSISVPSIRMVRV